MVSKIRAQRIGDRIREELSTILVTQSSDPRLVGVYVTGVDLDRELEYATVFISAIEGIERSKEILEGFQHAQGFLRSELSHRIVLRTFPRLRFRWDPTYERADKIEQLFAQIKEQELAQKERANGKNSSQDQGETGRDANMEEEADE